MVCTRTRVKRQMLTRLVRVANSEIKQVLKDVGPTKATSPSQLSNYSSLPKQKLRPLNDDAVRYRTALIYPNTLVYKPSKTMFPFFLVWQRPCLNAGFAIVRPLIFHINALKMPPSPPSSPCPIPAPPPRVGPAPQTTAQASHLPRSATTRCHCAVPALPLPLRSLGLARR